MPPRESAMQQQDLIVPSLFFATWLMMIIWMLMRAS